MSVRSSVRSRRAAPGVSSVPSGRPGADRLGSFVFGSRSFRPSVRRTHRRTDGRGTHAARPRIRPSVGPVRGPSRLPPSVARCRSSGTDRTAQPTDSRYSRPYVCRSVAGRFVPRIDPSFARSFFVRSLRGFIRSFDRSRMHARVGADGSFIFDSFFPLGWSCARA